MKNADYHKLSQLDRIEYLLAKKEVEYNPVSFGVVLFALYAISWYFLFAILLFGFFKSTILLSYAIDIFNFIKIIVIFTIVLDIVLLIFFHIKRKRMEEFFLNKNKKFKDHYGK